MEDFLTGRRIMIRSAKDGSKVGDATVQRFNPHTRSLFVRPTDLLQRGNMNVRVLFPEEGGLLEFKGFMNSASREREVEILLSAPRHVNHRMGERHEIYAEGKITHVVIDGQLIELRRGIEVQALNLSVGGALIAAGAGALTVGQSFRMVLNVEGEDHTMDCEAVRTQNSSFLTEEYGCRINNMWKAADGGQA